MAAPMPSNGTTAAGNATKPAGGRDFLILREQVNYQVATNYAAFLASLIGVFIILHWSRYVVTRVQRSDKTSLFPGFLAVPFVWVSRGLRNVLVRQIPGFPSSGHGLLVAVYVAANVAMIFTNVDTSRSPNIASRFAWMLTANLAFVVFLALKNTPLAVLTSYSYERLNCLHQIAGCTTFLMVVVHGSTYASFFASMDRLEVLRENEQIAAMVAAFAFLVMVASALLMRHFWYEAFYVTHITSFIVAIICVGFHRSEFRHKTPIILCVTGAIWVTDRAIRMTRLAVYGVNNKATVYPLPGGGTRIILAKRPAMAVPGKHCFLWLPSVRRFETHPFTIIDTNPMEFVVKSYNGFTRDLHKFAAANPGAAIRASVDGPYSTFPDPMLYDRVVLIAGGSGASFTFGLAVNLLDRMGPDSTKSIDFIWIVQKHENLTWFTEHLRTLHSHPSSPRCKVSLYATRASRSDSSSDEATGLPRIQTAGQGSGGPRRSPTSPDLEKVLRERSPVSPSNASSRDEKAAAMDSHSEAQAAFDDTDKETRVDREAASQSGGSTSTVPLRHKVTAGRPDAETLIRSAVAETSPDQRVLVAACGPASLMKVVRNTTASCIRPDGPGIELHCEQFGW